MIGATATPRPEYRALDLLTAPVWVVEGRENEVVFANKAAEQLSAKSDLHELRHGSHSAHAEEHLTSYLPALRACEPIIEIWTLFQHGEAVPLSCQLSLLDQNPPNERILVEGILGLFVV